MPEPRIALAPSVLFSQYLRDFLLLMAWKGEFFYPIWSKEINNTWMRNILIENQTIKKESLDQIEQDMNLIFPEADADSSLAYERIQAITFKNEADRYTLAAAVAANGDYIFTMNLKDFPQEALDLFGIREIHPDAFFSELSTQEEIERMIDIFSFQLAAYKSSPLRVQDLIDMLKRSGMKRTAEILTRTNT